MSKARDLADSVAAGSVLADGVVSLSEVGGGTNNGVVFVNGGGTTTSGSALTFDGTFLGVGVASPLFVKASIAASNPETSIGSQYNPGILNIQNTSATNGNLSLIGFQDASSFINLAAIGAVNVTHSGSPNNVVGQLAFYTKAFGSSYIEEGMRLTSTGLGIGTSSPAYKLDVNGAARVNNLLWFTPSSGLMAIGASGTNFNIYNGSGAETRLTIDSSGELTTTNGKFNLITVGRGAGAVATNTAVGASALAANTSGLRSTAFGYQALTAQTTSDGNSAFGHAAGSAITTGQLNTAIGRLALGSNITSDQNTAVGYGSLYSGTGASNTGLGYRSLTATSSGQYNVAVGADALQANTTASNNTAVGYQAGYTNTTGTGITALGYQALQNSTGNHNTAVGFAAGNQTTTGLYNSAFGYQAFKLNTTGERNAALSYEALYNNTTGSYNTAVGMWALNANTTASNNTAVGYQSGYSNQTGTRITAIGYQAAKGGAGSAPSYSVAVGSYALSAVTSGDSNVAVGDNTLPQLTTGAANSFVGGGAGNALTTGSYNTAVGTSSLFSNTTASGNTAVGYRAAYSNTTGTANAAFGFDALYGNTTGSSNTALGYYALVRHSTGTSNVAVGTSALEFNTTASYNTALGYQAGYSNTTGNSNTYIGRFAGYTNTVSGNNLCVGDYAGYFSTGADNTFVGARGGAASGEGAGYQMTTGSKNTIIGKFGGNQGSLDIRTSSNYIVLSDGDGNPRGIFDSNGLFIAGATSATAQAHSFRTSSASSNVICATNTTTSAPYGIQVRYTGIDPNSTGSGYFEAYNDVASAYRFVVYSNGGIANYQANDANLSDRREKTNFAPAKPYLDTICAIPVQTFNYIDQNMEEDGGLTLGVVAQDVQAVAPELVMESNWAGKDDEPKMRLSIYQTDLQYALMKCIQELKSELDTVKAELATLKGN